MDHTDLSIIEYVTNEIESKKYITALALRIAIEKKDIKMIEHILSDKKSVERILFFSHRHGVYTSDKNILSVILNHTPPEYKFRVFNSYCDKHHELFTHFIDQFAHPNNVQYIVDVFHCRPDDEGCDTDIMDAECILTYFYKYVPNVQEWIDKNIYSHFDVCRTLISLGGVFTKKHINTIQSCYVLYEFQRKLSDEEYETLLKRLNTDEHKEFVTKLH